MRTVSIQCECFSWLYNYMYFVLFLATELLNKYQSKLSEVQKAKQKIASLQSELEEMTDNFSEAAKKYKKCYKTP